MVVSALERRKRSLMRFYQKYDAGRIKNIDPLFEHFSFGLILEAIKKKYKKLPEDWEYEKFKDLVGHISNKKIAVAMKKQGLDASKVLGGKFSSGGRSAKEEKEPKRTRVKPPPGPPPSRSKKKTRGKIRRGSALDEEEEEDDIENMFSNAPAVNMSRASARDRENPDFAVSSRMAAPVSRMTELPPVKPRMTVAPPGMSRPTPPGLNVAPRMTPEPAKSPPKMMKKPPPPPMSAIGAPRPTGIQPGQTIPRPTGVAPAVPKVQEPNIDMGNRANKLAALLGGGSAPVAAAPKKAEPQIDMGNRANKLAALLGGGAPAAAPKKAEPQIDMGNRANKLAALLGGGAPPAATKKAEPKVDMGNRANKLAALLGGGAEPAKAKPMNKTTSAPTVDPTSARKTDGGKPKAVAAKKPAPGGLFAKMHGLLGAQMGGAGGSTGGGAKKPEVKKDAAKAAAVAAKFANKGSKLKTLPISDGAYDKYRKMQKMKLPEGAIRNCLEKDGLDPDHFFNGGGGAAAAAPAVSKPAMTIPKPAVARTTAVKQVAAPAPRQTQQPPRQTQQQPRQTQQVTQQMGQPVLQNQAQQFQPHQQQQYHQQPAQQQNYHPQAQQHYEQQYQQQGYQRAQSQYNMQPQSSAFYREGPAYDYGGVGGSEPNANGWTTQWSEEYKRPYFFNEFTGESSWVPPPGM